MEKAKRGRPEGQQFPYVHSVRFGERDQARLKALAAKLEMPEAAVWRLALRKLAEAEGLE